jgi:adenine phosphoribosyltransferase
MKTIEKLQMTMNLTKERADSVLRAYVNSETYIIDNSEGSIKNYHYFLYPFKNFSDSDPRDEEFIAKHLSLSLDKNIDYIITFDSDGIGISKLISVILNIPMLVCKPFHYNQAVFSLKQRTGYFEREMFCPRLINGKKIVILDCMVSTGGTVKGFVEALRLNKIDVKVVGIYTVVNKTNYHSDAENMFGKIPYKFLFNVLIKEDGSVNSSISDLFREIFWKKINAEIINTSKRIAKNSDQSRNKFKVGAIIIDNETFEILGWGNKGKYVHAEEAALEMAKKNGDLSGKDLTLYTNLEPCSYRNMKNRIPCSRLIEEESSIKWVVVGNRDKRDKKNFGLGLKRLVEAGKYVVCLEDHPSIPINFSGRLSERRSFN